MASSPPASSMNASPIAADREELDIPLEVIQAFNELEGLIVAGADFPDLPQVDFRFTQLLSVIMDHDIPSPDRKQQAIYFAMRCRFHSMKASFLESRHRDADAQRERMRAAMYQPQVSQDKPSPHGPEATVDANVDLRDNSPFGIRVTLVDDWSKLVHQLQPYLQQDVLNGLRCINMRTRQTSYTQFFRNIEVIEKTEKLVTSLRDNLLLQYKPLAADRPDVKPADYDKQEQCIAIFDSQMELMKALQWVLKLEFMQMCIGHSASDLRRVLFEGTPIIKRSLDERFRQLKLLFHPDKNTAPRSYEERSDKKQADGESKMFNTFIQLVCDLSRVMKDQMKQSMRSASSVQHYSNLGHEFWAKARQLQGVQRYKLSQAQPKPANYATYENWSDTELETTRVGECLLAFQHWREALQLLNVSSLLTVDHVGQQLDLQLHIAQALYGSGQAQYLEAQLYCVGGLFVIDRYRIEIGRTPGAGAEYAALLDQRQGLFQELLDRISRGRRDDPIVANQRQGQQPQTASQALIPLDAIRGAQLPREHLLSTIQLRALVVDRSLALAITSHYYIVKAEENAALWKTAGHATQATGVLSGMAGIGAAGLEIIVGSAFGPVTIGVVAVGSIAAIVGGLFLGHHCFKKADELLREPSLRRNLNDIISKAIQAHQRCQFEAFFTELAKRYGDQDGDRTDCFLITFTPQRNLNIDPHRVIDILLNHQFLPEGIAYLLSLMASAVIDGRKDLVLEEELSAIFDQLPFEIYKAIRSSNRLLSRSKHLDQTMKNARSSLARAEVYRRQYLSYSNYAVKTIARILGEGAASTLAFYKLFHLTTAGVDPDMMKDKRITETTFVQRLSEVRQVCMINSTILTILMGLNANLGSMSDFRNSRDFRLASETVKAVRAEMNQKHLYLGAIASSRIQALEDIMVTLGYPLEEDAAPSVTLGLLTAGAMDASAHINKIFDISNDRYDDCGRVVRFVRSSASEPGAGDGINLLECCQYLLDGMSFPDLNDFRQLLQSVYQRSPSTYGESLPFDTLIQIMDGVRPQDEPTGVWTNNLTHERIHDHLQSFLRIIAIVWNVEFCSVLLQHDHRHGLVARVIVNSAIKRDHQSSPIVRIFYTSVDPGHVGRFFIAASASLQFLLAQLKSSVLVGNERSAALLKVAKYYEAQAERYDSAANHVKAMAEWTFAEKYYSRLFDWEVNDPAYRRQAVFGKCRARFHLDRPLDAIDILLRNEALCSADFDFHFLLARYHRKAQQYDRAGQEINDALINARAQQDSPARAANIRAASKEQEVINALKSESPMALVRRYQNVVVQMDFQPQRLVGRPLERFNIISCDGGGIRGIIPAVWLCEIERETKKPISKLFHLGAGTSTGAVLLSAVSVPVSHDLPKQPKFTAAALLDLYASKGASIFTRNLWSFARAWPRYTELGKRREFSTYFDEYRLSHCVMDLVIPTYRSDYLSGPFYFKTINGLSDSNLNYRLFDVNMATSAAPTYWESYKFDNCHMYDGGVVMNNPAMAAYSTALADYRVETRQVQLLSLGTGDFIPDPIDPKRGRNALFWATNTDALTHALLSVPALEMDNNLAGILPSGQLARWQVWFDHAVRLDAYDAPNRDFLINCAREYIYEMKYNETLDDQPNRFKKTIDNLLASVE